MTSHLRRPRLSSPSRLGSSPSPTTLQGRLNLMSTLSTDRSDPMATGAYPVQLLHSAAAAAAGAGQWHNLGAGHAAVRILRPQGHSLVMYAGPDGTQQQRIVFAYPILPGDAFERLDGVTLSWAEPESGNEFALCFLDEPACAAVCAAISPVTRTLATLDGVAERLAGLRMAREEGAPAGEDIAGRLAQLSIGRP